MSLKYNNTNSNTYGVSLILLRWSLKNDMQPDKGWSWSENDENLGPRHITDTYIGDT